MPLDFMGMDPETKEEGSATVWVHHEQQRIIIQGVTADDALTEEVDSTEWVPGHAVGIPAHESVISLPLRMVPILRKACDAAERAGLSDAAPERAEDSSPSGDA
ncbi:hypothetical protein BLA24_16245 [Streptomyces cinnamoneus]|uniref:Uncharacterized protein n=1 Tax=Streptomyces cinnamoneus TaxID=53446 RepID=A0A2G1XJG8_STRCJ|nr:hypothetical protein [Streptomyces cinnamoneus]PHQ51376.1 hypothetical protein BLA24_16245 [Streptomyces cinnamoneus]PPT16502.1 hypothetical protein CYQ11_11830 [Streptomyces cinnamoneus]